MSFQRMFEMARRHGVPVVVTDKEGKDPMVILPLEVYEALTEGALSPQASASIRKSEAAEANEPIVVPVRSVPEPNSKSSGRLERMAVEVNRGFDQEVTQTNLADLSLEERFYIETMEDGQK
jgi:hypothetical protein